MRPRFKKYISHCNIMSDVFGIRIGSFSPYSIIALSRFASIMWLYDELHDQIRIKLMCVSLIHTEDLCNVRFLTPEVRCFLRDFWQEVFFFQIGTFREKNLSPITKWLHVLFVLIHNLYFFQAFHKKNRKFILFISWYKTRLFFRTDINKHNFFIAH